MPSTHDDTDDVPSADGVPSADSIPSADGIPSTSTREPEPNQSEPTESEAAPNPSPGDPPDRSPGGRELTVGVTMLAGAVALIGILVGGLMAGVSLAGQVFSAWQSAGPLSPGVVGAAMVGVAPGLFMVGRARIWEEVRTLVLPLVIVLLGLLAVSLLNADKLQAAEGGSLFLVLFSLGWVAVLGVLGVCAVGCLVRQYVKPGRPREDRDVPLEDQGVPREDRGAVPLPGWSKPFLAVLGSAWFGSGVGLLALPGFWGDFVPWQVDRPDAQALGVWGLALGVGVLGALAEDDLRRLRPALLALPGIAVAVAVVVSVRASDVDWTSGPGLALIGMVSGLLVAGVTGWRLLSAPSS
ncbi:hypothetical protein ACFY12_26335 [Streptomyces sp. NPDC001339]|uniref:hypothetical protein n=1 Tax=Streptomyces sp. NPDC001339 TaxID=3364563 RepID=UPI00369300F2